MEYKGSNSLFKQSLLKLNILYISDSYRIKIYKCNIGYTSTTNLSIITSVFYAYRKVKLYR